MRLIANIIFYTTYSSLCCVQHKDDILTKGFSYARFACQLEKLGGEVLGGFFLGKTVVRI